MNFPKNTIIVFSLAAALCLGTAFGDNAKVGWSFLLGDYNTEYDADGIPLNIGDYPRWEYPPDFYERLSVALPERTDVRTTNPDYITDNGANIFLDTNADVFITFLHEGAAYRNSVGLFTFQGDVSTVTRESAFETIIFPNTSFSSAGGGMNGLRVGNTVLLGQFSAGTNLGFVIAGNGFDNSYGVNPNQNPNHVFYSIADLNAETEPALRAHTIMLYDAPTETVILGMEDVLRTRAGCDHDFNDALFTIHTNPPDAINTLNFLSVPEPVDSDGDGVVDTNDDFPDDSDRAFRRYYPSSTTYATLAFEDRWPLKGDYDMNDLVLRYQIEEITDRDGNIRDIFMSIRPIARGATYHNGFAFEFTGVASSDVDSALLRIDGGTWSARSPEPDQTFANFVISHDIYEFTPSNSDRFFNVEQTGSPSPPVQIDFFVTFTRAISSSEILSAPYNPYIFRSNDRGLEIHLPGYPATDLANDAYFQTGDDDSNPGIGRYFVTSSNLPWALNIPYKWRHPKERIEIIKAYGGFAPWVHSGGSDRKNWYTELDGDTFLYPHELD
jgi:LruC domain-containing protein